MRYKVYKHTSPNNKIYIGITAQPLERRWRKGEGYKDNILLYRAIKKYGWDNFKHEVLFENISKDEAEKLEIQLIKEHRSNNPEFGYNIENGGKSVGTLAENTKEKLRLANIGKKASDEAKEHMRQAQKERVAAYGLAKGMGGAGEKNPFYGKQHSEETKQILREKNGGTNSPWYGKRHTAEEKQKIAKSRMKKVCQLDAHGNILATFDSLHDAAVHVGAKSQSAIGQCANGKRKQANGYIWKYYKELFPEQE